MILWKDFCKSEVNCKIEVKVLSPDLAFVPVSEYSYSPTFELKFNERLMT